MKIRRTVYGSYQIDGLFRPANRNMVLVSKRGLAQLRDAIDLLLKWEGKENDK